MENIQVRNDDMREGEIHKGSENDRKIGGDKVEHEYFLCQCVIIGFLGLVVLVVVELGCDTSEDGAYRRDQQGEQDGRNKCLTESAER